MASGGARRGGARSGGAERFDAQDAHQNTVAGGGLSRRTAYGVRRGALPAQPAGRLLAVRVAQVCAGLPMLAVTGALALTPQDQESGGRRATVLCASEARPSGGHEDDNNTSE